MLSLCVSKVESLYNVNADSIRELDKYLGVINHLVKKDSKSISPLQPEYITAMTSLGNIEQGGNFDNKKATILSILNTLITTLQANSNDTPSMNLLLHGKQNSDNMHQIEFALYLVEQNNIDYFKSRQSAYETQEHERFYEYYMCRWNADKFMFIWREDKDLPQHIKDETKAAIDLVFGKSGQQVN